MGLNLITDNIHENGLYCYSPFFFVKKIKIKIFISIIFLIKILIMKKIVKLNESDLDNIITEALKNVGIGGKSQGQEQWKHEAQLFMAGLRNGNAIVEDDIAYVQIFKRGTAENDPRYVYIRKGDKGLHDDHFYIQNSPILGPRTLKAIYDKLGWNIDDEPEMVNENVDEGLLGMAAGAILDNMVLQKIVDALADFLHLDRNGVLYRVLSSKLFAMALGNEIQNSIKLKKQARAGMEDGSSDTSSLLQSVKSGNIKAIPMLLGIRR